MQGKESLQLYKKAIELISESLKTSSLDMNGKLESDKDVKTSIYSSKKTPETLNHEVSNAFCAVAELWMTDLCDETEAESECASSIAKAVEADNSNPEAWQTKARFHMIKSEFEVDNLLKFNSKYEDF